MENTMKQIIILIILLLFMNGCTILVLRDGTMVTAPGRLNNEEIYALNQKYISDNASRSLNTFLSGPLPGWDLFSNRYMYPYDHFNNFHDPFYVGYYPYYWYQYPYLPSYYYDDVFEDWVEYRKDLRNNRIEQIHDRFEHRREDRLDRREHFRDAMNDMTRNIRHMREPRIKRRRNFFSIR